jgi:hypothetical protein
MKEKANETDRERLWILDIRFVGVLLLAALAVRGLLMAADRTIQRERKAELVVLDEDALIENIFTQAEIDAILGDEKAMDGYVDVWAPYVASAHSVAMQCTDYAGYNNPPLMRGRWAFTVGWYVQDAIAALGPIYGTTCAEHMAIAGLPDVLLTRQSVYRDDWQAYARETAHNAVATCCAKRDGPCLP